MAIYIQTPNSSGRELQDGGGARVSAPRWSSTLAPLPRGRLTQVEVRWALREGAWNPRSCSRGHQKPLKHSWMSTLNTRDSQDATKEPLSSPPWVPPPPQNKQRQPGLLVPGLAHPAAPQWTSCVCDNEGKKGSASEECHTSPHFQHVLPIESLSRQSASGRHVAALLPCRTLSITHAH